MIEKLRFALGRAEHIVGKGEMLVTSIFSFSKKVSFKASDTGSLKELAKDRTAYLCSLLPIFTKNNYSDCYERQFQGWKKVALLGGNIPEGFHPFRKSFLTAFCHSFVIC